MTDVDVAGRASVTVRSKVAWSTPAVASASAVTRVSPGDGCRGVGHEAVGGDPRRQPAAGVPGGRGAVVGRGRGRGGAAGEPEGPGRQGQRQGDTASQAARPGDGRWLENVASRFGFLSWDRSPGTPRREALIVLRLCPVVHDGASRATCTPGIPARRPGLEGARPTVAGQRRDSTGFPRRCRTRCAVMQARGGHGGQSPGPADASAPTTPASTDRSPLDGRTSRPTAPGGPSARLGGPGPLGPHVRLLREAPVSKPIPYSMPDVRHRRRAPPPPQAAPGGRVPAVRQVRLQRGRGRPHHRPRPRAHRPLLGEPVRASTSASSRASDLILVNHDGEVVEGDYAVNAAAFAIHSQVHAARPDMNAAAHAHSVNGKAFSSLGRLLDPITQDVVRLLRRPRRCSTTTPASCSTPRRASASPTPSATTRPPSCATTACSPSGADGRRGGLVVHHHGAHLPGPAAGQRGRARRC